MRKIKEVLRLRYEVNLDQRQIARSCSISVSTVHEYLKRAEGAKVQWPLPDGWNDAHWKQLFTHRRKPSRNRRSHHRTSPPSINSSARTAT